MLRKTSFSVSFLLWCYVADTVNAVCNSFTPAFPAYYDGNGAYGQLSGATYCNVQHPTSDNTTISACPSACLIDMNGDTGTPLKANIQGKYNLSELTDPSWLYDTVSAAMKQLNQPKISYSDGCYTITGRYEACLLYNTSGYGTWVPQASCVNGTLSNCTIDADAPIENGTAVSVCGYEPSYSKNSGYITTININQSQVPQYSAVPSAMCNAAGFGRYDMLSWPLMAVLVGATMAVSGGLLVL